MRTQRPTAHALAVTVLGIVLAIAEAAAPRLVGTVRASDPVIRPGAVLVRLDGTRAASKVAAALPSGAVLGPRIAPRLFATGLYNVTVPPGAEASYAARLGAVPGVSWAQVDHAVRALDEVGAVAPGEASRPPDRVGRRADAGFGRTPATVTPDDPSFAEQWNLVDVRLPEAWAVVTDAARIPVAVLDTGARLDHPDLAGQIWLNRGEVAANGIDDDRNGFVDDVNGWHFYQKVDYYISRPRDDADLADANGHGTFTAGIVGAFGGNRIGVVGAAWRATLVIVRTMGDDKVGWESDVVRGLDYAVAAGARVASLSFGAPQASPALAEAAARSEKAGMLLVAATGNDGGAVMYPAALPSVLAVGASDRTRRRAGFSSFGPPVDLVAPGTDILSTWSGRPYMIASGTSASAPLVAGVAALMLARRPDMTPAEVRTCLKVAATDLDPPGRDDETGAGLLDAARAVGGCGEPVHLPRVARGLTRAH